MIKKKREKLINKVVTFLILFAIILVLFVTSSKALSLISLNGANLTIWDDSDGSIRKSGWDFGFYSNYTNSTTGVNFLTGNCTIRFENYTGAIGPWINMSYNSTYGRFQYNTTFNYKGTYRFEVNCTNSSNAQINVSDNYTLTNSIPTIRKESGGDWIDTDGNPLNHNIWPCAEDTPCYYNFSANVSDLDVNDVLTYSVGTNTSLTNYTLDENRGMLLINITNNNYTGSGKRIELRVKDNDPDTLWQSALLDVTITTTNDPPVFNNLFNESFNATELFERIITISDEENDRPYLLNISFLNCSTAEWSTRNNVNCTLFNSSQYSYNATTGILNISFTPSRNDVGNYTLNFTVTDSGASPASTTVIINYNVLNVNSVPYFRYVCDNERNGKAGVNFVCRINATDIDETNNLTLTANYSWFKINGSNSSTFPCNLSTNYNISAIVNFTPTHSEVGNWSINISVFDTGNPQRANSTIFWLYINNTPAAVSLDPIDAVTLYQNRTIYVNATDEDLLIPDKSVLNESLTFASNASWVSVTPYSSPAGTNYTTARIHINYDLAFSLYGRSNQTVRINVTDVEGNYAERNFSINISSANAPTWNSSLAEIVTVIGYKHNLTYLNLSQNVSNPDGDPLTFTFTNDTSFPSFNLSSAGIVNFTPVEEDVGQHMVTIIVSTGKLSNQKIFNFTIYNVDSDPVMQLPISATSASVDPNSNVNATEDNATVLTLYVRDDDFKIVQKNFFNETLTLTMILEGVNGTLLNFTADPAFPVAGSNLTKFDATFTPRKADVGRYNITLNVTDKGNLSQLLRFNLTVNAINHPPVMMNLTNQTSAIGKSLYYKINATDVEDGTSGKDNINFTFGYTFVSGNDIFNFTTFNSTTGEINITFNSSNYGLYKINLTVNDSQAARDSKILWLKVYDYPNITFPLASEVFNLKENVTSNLVFTANHSLGDNLTYNFFLNGLRYNLSYYGDNTNLVWQFTPNFTDETYGFFKNITLLVLNSIYPELNYSIDWNANVTHTNAPLIFSGTIGDMQANYNQNINVNLSRYFSDADHDDPYYNQTINFTLSSNSTASEILGHSSISSDWILSLGATTTVSEYMHLNATDVNETGNMTQASSNIFNVIFTTPSTSSGSVPTPISYGGSVSLPISLKVLLPGPVSAFRKEKITVPITVANEGSIDLYDVSLNGSVVKDGRLRQDLQVLFDKTYFTQLRAGQREKITLTIYTESEDSGMYEITLNATSKSPVYQDWGKLYVNLQDQGQNKTLSSDSIIFTEDLIANNPECIEIQEVVKEAQKYYNAKNYEMALAKSQQAIEACKAAVEQTSLPQQVTSFSNNIILYRNLALASLSAIVMGMLYYFYRRIKLTKYYKQK